MIEHEEKVAILLHVLGGPTVEPALKMLEPEKAEAIRARLSKLKEFPPSVKRIEGVVDDFERFFKFAVEAAGAQNYWSQLTVEHEEIETNAKNSEDEVEEVVGLGLNYGGVSHEIEDAEQRLPDKPKFRIFEPTEDEVEDLNRLHPLQIAEALRGERTKTMAIILNCLEKSRKAEVIDNLPAEIHGELVSLLISDMSVQPELLRRMVRTVVEKAMTVESPEEEIVDPLESIAGVMRELPRATRNNMLNHLRETDEENADRIQKLLFLFTDILNYDDKSVQKILAEVDKSQLVIALQPSSEEIKNKVFDNLSKRAKLSLEEELELMGKPSSEAVKQAQDIIAEIIGRLDQAEQLELQ